MTYVFSEKEKAAARREKKILFWTWFALLIVYLGALASLISVDLYLVEVHRNRSHTFWMGALSTVLTIAFFSYTLFFYAIKFRLTRRYVRMLRDMDKGLKDEFEGTFMGYDESLGMKDGVYFYSMMLKTKPLRRDDIDERKLLIEQTVPKIELTEGAKLKLVSHANILVAYEVIDGAKPKAETQTSDTEEQNA